MRAKKDIFIQVMILGLSLIPLTACAKEQNKNIDQQVQSYVDTFYNEAAQRGIGANSDVDATIVDTLPNHGANSSALATCITGNRNAVYVMRDAWGSFTPDERRYLIYHELGHCALGRRHKDEDFKITYKAEDNTSSSQTVLTADKSIMNTYFKPSAVAYIAAHWDAYLNELFMGIEIPEETEIKVPRTTLDHFSVDANRGVSITWSNAMDLGKYEIYRNGQLIGTTEDHYFTDSVPASLHTVSYTIQPILGTLYGYTVITTQTQSLN